VDFIVQWKEMVQKDTEKKITLIGGVRKFHKGKGREGFPIARGPKNTEGDPETQQKLRPRHDDVGSVAVIIVCPSICLETKTTHVTTLVCIIDSNVHTMRLGAYAFS
jgi:hypothetical protein